jgi:diguanylate cyclase (GGDEF)-like protein/PAS domain S-box-containing protein
MKLDFAQIMQSLNLGIIVLDRDLRIVFWNRWMEEQSRMESAEVIGRDITELFPELEQKGFRWKAENVFKLGTYAFFSQQIHGHLIPLPLTRYLTSSFEYMQQNVTLSPVRNADGKVAFLCATIEECTDAVLYREKLEQAKRELETMSLTDPLTELPNRRHLMETLQREVSQHNRLKRSLSVAILDVDHFKAVNDTHGHLCGDHVLTQLGALLRERLRTYDFIARYGGEEFCAVLPNTRLEEAFLVMERLRSAVQACSFAFDQKALHLTVSIGIASNEIAEAPNLDLLLLRADEALYRSKVSGRNRTEVASYEGKVEGYAV